MRGKVRSFRRIAARHGVKAALLEAVQFATPSINQLPAPRKQQARFYKKATHQALGAPLPWSKSLELVREGFLPQAHYLYAFEEHGPQAYLSDYTADVHARSINQPHADLLDDKLRFHRSMADRGFQDQIPDLIGVLGQDLEGDDLLDALDEEGALVVKARRGGGGSRVHLCHRTPSAYRFDGDEIQQEQLQARADELEGYLVTEHCQPAEYARELYPRTPNTLRIVTMNPADGDPFVAAAVHRIGADSTGPVDNFSQGGLSTSVDDEGALGPGVRLTGWQARWNRTHPDTGAPIEGVRIPGWPRIRDEMIEMAREIPETPYVGWDLIVRGPGEHTVIEANTNTDVDLLQAHGPLLEDGPTRRFYQDHGVA